MKAIILCNQQKSETNSLTENTPNCLFRLCGKTLLEYILDQLIKADFKEATIISDDFQEMIESELADKYKSMCIEYSNEEEKGFEYMKSLNQNDDLLIIESDSIFNFNLNKIIMFHTVQKSYCTIISTESENFYNFTCFSVGNDGFITSVIQKPSADNNCAKDVFSGIYILSKNILSNYSFELNRNFINDILPEMISNNKKVSLYKEQRYWQKIYDVNSLLKCQKDLLENKTGIEILSKLSNNKIYSNTNSSFNGATIIPPVYIGKNVSIQPGAIINSGSVIDDNVSIESGVTIENSYVGRNTIIKSNCKLKASIIYDNCLIQNNVLCEENTIIGNNSKIGSNVKIKSEARIYDNTEISSNSIINSNIKHGNKHRFYIDDDYECCFGISKSQPFDISLLGMAIGTSLNKSDIVIVGYEENKASKALANCLISGILSAGVTVFNIAQSNLQQVMFCGLKLGGIVGCYVDANFSLKIKLFGKGCLPLSSTIENSIEKSFNQKSFRTVSFLNWGNSFDFSGASQLYNNYLIGLLPNKFDNLNIQIKTSSIETAKIADSLFYPRNDINSNKTIFHISDDGMKCTAYTEKTNFVTHEKLLLLCIKIYISKGLEIYIPDSFLKTAETFTENLNGKLYHYNKNSDKTIIKKVESESNLFTKDSLMLICVISNYLYENKIDLYEALKDIPDVFVIQRYLSINGDSQRIAEELNNYLDKESNDKNNSNTQIKSLKNKKGIMLIAESSKAEIASSLCDDLQERINKLKK